MFTMVSPPGTASLDALALASEKMSEVFEKNDSSMCIRSASIDEKDPSHSDESYSSSDDDDSVCKEKYNILANSVYGRMGLPRNVASMMEVKNRHLKKTTMNITMLPEEARKHLTVRGFRRIDTDSDTCRPPLSVVNFINGSKVMRSIKCVDTKAATMAEDFIVLWATLKYPTQQQTFVEYFNFDPVYYMQNSEITASMNSIDTVSVLKSYINKEFGRRVFPKRTLKNAGVAKKLA
jgi:hypothetical protein